MFEITFSPPGPGRPISPKGPTSPYLQKRRKKTAVNSHLSTAFTLIRSGQGPEPA